MLKPRQAQTPEAKAALAIFRAVALSRKQPATIKQLLRDYTELEGHGVNYRKYGYDHLEDFLVESGEFIIHNMQGEMYLTPRPSPESNHIREMINHQKRSKKQAALKFREPFKSDQSWNKSSYSSNVYDKLPSPRKLSKRSNERNNHRRGDSNNNNKSNNRNSSNSTTGQNYKTKTFEETKITLKSQQQQQKQQQITAIQKVINSARTNLQDRLKQSQTMITKDLNNKTQQQNVPNNTHQQHNGGEKQQQGQSGQEKSSMIDNNSLQQQQQQKERRFSEESVHRLSSAMKTIGRTSIQDRLKIAQQQQQQQSQLTFRNNSINDDNNSPPPPPRDLPNNLVIRNNSNTVISNEPEKTIKITTKISDKIEQQQQQQKQYKLTSPSPTPSSSSTTKPFIFEFNPNLDAVTSLSQYCAIRNYEQPVYKFIKSRVSSSFHARVIINGVTYSTYPDEFDTEFYAKLGAATKAIDEIKLQETRLRYPICLDSDLEISLKIYDEIKNHLNGIFHKKIPEIFELRYEKTLPDNWFSIIQESNMFTFEMTVGDNMIILAKEETTDLSSASTSESSDVLTVDRISLPWETKYWNLYITYCSSTVEIWARIVDNGYNDKLDSLMNDIDVYMLTEKQRPTSIICGQIYLISISECWHRIRVEEMKKDTGQCLCFFIDFGDEEWLQMEQLYLCETKFLILPPQAICFSLFGLEDFADNPSAKKHLDKLTGKSLVAEILTKRENFENIEEDGIMNLNNIKIQCVLYDTSTNEDVNLNPLILNQICDDTQPPDLKRTGVNNVYVTHVLDNGELYIQIRNMELQYVQKLVQQLVESKFKKDQHKVTNNDMKTTKLFFVQDPDNGRWYRGTLVIDLNDDSGNNGRTEQKNSDDYYNIFYVDYGLTKCLPITNIYRLDSLSAALSTFPKQAIKVKLHKLPIINERIIGLIRGLLPSETPAIVKVAVNAVVPQVIVYKRFEDKGGLFNVNESIQIEYELERCLLCVCDHSNDYCTIHNFFSSNELINDNTQQSSLLMTTSIGSASSTASSTIATSGNSVALSGSLGKIVRQNSIQLNTTTIFDTTSLGPHSPINSIRALSQRTPITVPTSPQKDLPKLLENIFIPKIGEYFDIIVTMASNPSNFMVRPYNDGPKLAEMMEELKAYCSSNDEFIPIDMIEEGQAYAAYDSDGYYYRVTVENIFKTNIIHVHYCDFGGVAILSNDKLKTLPAKFRTLPKQAIAAKLSGVKPKYGDWTLEDCIRFQQLTVKQKFVSIINDITDDPVVPGTRMLELKLIDVQTDDDIYIDDILFTEQRAIRC